MLRDAGGPVTRLQLAPKWLMPPAVIATSPQGDATFWAQSDAVVERTVVHHEVRHLFGPNLFDVTHEAWLPRRRALQPVFTKQHVRAFGGHMAQAAEMVATRMDRRSRCRPGRRMPAINAAGAGPLGAWRRSR